MAFDGLKPQAPRTAANTRHPETAIAYGVAALARSHAAAGRCRTVLEIAFGPDEDQKLDLYLPDDPAARGVPVILFFHGGAWAHGYKEWAGFMAPVLVDAPAIFVSAGYRLAPEHKFPAPLEDAFAALQWVDRNIADHGGDPNRIFAAGWSVGGTLAALITLRRELYAGWDLPDGIVKACFAACAGFAYRADVLAPGDGGLTYGDLLYDRPGDETLASPLDHVGGNRTPFYISHASGDFEHVRRSSAAMAEALAREGCVVEYDVFEGLDHYQCNLAHGDPDNRWVGTVRAWIGAPPRT
jgi:acetyl esterase/lipase